MPIPLEVSDICLPPAVQQAGSADKLVAERTFPLALRFMAARRGGTGLTRRGLGLLARQHGIASRNTAYAFFDEALKYEVVLPVGMGEEVVPSALTLSILTQW